MCMTDNDNGPSMHNEQMRKARKTHKCNECSREINAGETYHYSAGVWDGDFLTMKTCQHCHAGMKLLIRECNGFMYGDILEDLREHVCPSLPWAMAAARYVIGMRRKWLRFDGSGLMKTPTWTSL